MMMTHSRDHGATWEAATDITASSKPVDWGFVAFTVSGTQLRTGPHKGRLMMTMQFRGARAYGSYPITAARSALLVSDDHGVSWHVGGSSQVNMTDNEAAVAELADGTVVVNSRNYLGVSHYTAKDGVPIYPYGSSASAFNHSVHRGLSFSSDGGSSFGNTYFAPDLVDPVCEGAMLAGWDTPHGLGVVGNASLFFTNNPVWYARANLTLSVSVDGGCRWSHVARVATGNTEYSSIVQFRDGALGVAFDDGSGVECPPSQPYHCAKCVNETFKLIRLAPATEVDAGGQARVDH